MEKATVVQLAAVISENRGSFRVRVIFETYWERGETWPLRRVSLAIIQGTKGEQVRCELISQKTSRQTSHSTKAIQLYYSSYNTCWSNRKPISMKPFEKPPLRYPNLKNIAYFREYCLLSFKKKYKYFNRMNYVC